MSTLGPAPHSICYITRVEEYIDTYHKYCEARCTAVRTNNAVAVHSKAVECEGICAGAGLVAGTRTSACGPSLTNDTYDTRRETQRTAVCFNDAVPVHSKAVDGEGRCAGAGLVDGANASALGPSSTDDTYHKRRGT